MFAQEEARLLNHSYIGSEHLLLGLLHEGDGVAARALASVGVTLRAARDSVANIIGTGGSAPSGHIPFTPRAKKVLELSLREALVLGHNYIGTEHLLLGLVREGEGVGVQVLIGAGVEAADVAPFEPGSRIRVGGIGGIFEPALNESRRLGDDHVGVEHVLLAAFEQPNSVAARVLESFGLTKAEVEQRIIEMRGEGEQATPE